MSNAPNSPALIRAKKEKVKLEKVKEEKLRQQKSRDSGVSLDDGQQNGGLDASDDEDNVDGSLAANKKRKLEHHAEGGEDVEMQEAAEGDEGEGEEADEGVVALDDDGLLEDAESRTLAARDQDGYIPGSIVRITLKNFVTYDDVSFRPGPHLNMIIGPNGTGKSTIACAIALGLGYKATLLGRAEGVASYVKQGKEHGYIEIELKGHPGENNVTIKRQLQSQKNDNVYFVNGVKTTLKAVQETVNNFNVMIDNLCSFLPQDKVTEFARMTPIQLLEETQKAAMDGDRLLKQHERLKMLATELRGTNVDLRKKQTECSALERQNESLQRDAQRHEKRQDMENRVSLLYTAGKFSLYNEKKNGLEKLMKRKDAIKKRAEENRAVLKPLEDRLTELEDMTTKCRTNSKVQLSFQQTTQKKIHKVENDLKRNDSERRKLDRELTSLDEGEAAHQKKIQNVEQEIAELQEIVARGPGTSDLTALNKKNSELGARLRELRVTESAGIAKIDELNKQYNAAQNRIKRTQAEINSLKDKNNARLMNLRSGDMDCFRAVEWLRQNRQLFKGNVHEPPLLSLEVQDDRQEFTDAIERFISWGSLKTFICERADDYALLNHHLLDRLKLRVTTQDMSTYHGTPPPPVPLETIREMGFVDYAINMLNGEPRVLDFMCLSASLHEIPIGRQGQVDHAAVEQMEQIRRFAIGDMSYSLSTAKYGRRQVQSSMSQVKPARNLNVLLNNEELENLAAQEIELTHEATAIRQQGATATQAQHELKKQIEQVNQQRSACTTERNKLLAQLKTFETASMTLDARKKSLKELRKQPPVADQRARLRKKLAKFAEEQAELAQNLKMHRIASDLQQHDWNMLKLAALQSETNFRAASEVWEEAESSLNDLQEQYAEASAKFKRAKKVVRKCLDDAQEAMLEMTEDMKTRLNEMIADTGQLSPYEVIEEEIAELEAELQGVPSVSSDVIRRYREKKNQIESLKASIEILEANREKLESKVDKYRGKWEPPLRKLIDRVNEKFGQAFARFDCVGEVRLSEGDKSGPDGHLNYDQWCIEILVKFREKEELQLLTAERQSGGERSLSTILYLMSLTELGAAPFSLVDEINQGMDQRAERLVFDHMVQTTCQQKASQYFLITPKLLTGLQYHKLMRVLVVNNGDYLPEPGAFSFKQFVGRRAAIAAA